MYVPTAVEIIEDPPVIMRSVWACSHRCSRCVVEARAINSAYVRVLSYICSQVVNNKRFREYSRYKYKYYGYVIMMYHTLKVSQKDGDVPTDRNNNVSSFQLGPTAGHATSGLAAFRAVDRSVARPPYLRTCIYLHYSRRYCNKYRNRKIRGPVVPNHATREPTRNTYPPRRPVRRFLPLYVVF